MIYPSADKLEKWGSKYALVVLAAKRAKQIKSGAPPMINTDSRNPLTIALEEIAMGKITCDVPDNDLILPVSQEPEVAQLLAIPERSDEEEDLSLGAAEEETTLTLEEEESLENWEDESEEEEEVLGFIEDDEDEDRLALEHPVDVIEEEEVTPKAKRGRKAKTVEDDTTADVEDVDIDIDIDADLDIELDIDEDEEEEPSEE